MVVDEIVGVVVGVVVDEMVGVVVGVVVVAGAWLVVFETGERGEEGEESFVSRFVIFFLFVIASSILRRALDETFKPYVDPRRISCSSSASS